MADNGVLAFANAVFGQTVLTDEGTVLNGAYARLALAISSVSSTGVLTLKKGVVSTSPASGVGYAVGAGGTVTQITSRSTAVVLVPAACLSGLIQTDTSSLAAEAAATFTCANTAVEVGDVVVASIRSGSNGGNTAVTVTTVAANTFSLTVSNNNASGGTAETGAILINFCVIKAVST